MIKYILFNKLYKSQTDKPGSGLRPVGRKDRGKKKWGKY